MQKKLEADLISIAHRILQLKNKSDINQLYLETQKLYEKLAVLRFVEEHFGDAKPTIGQAEVVEKMKEFFETISVPDFPKPVSILTIEEKMPEIETIEHKSLPVEEPEIIEATEPTATIEVPEIIEEPKVEAVEKPETTTIEEPKVVAEKIAFEPIVESIEPAIPETQKKKEAVQISFDDLLGGKYTDPQFVKVSPSDKKLNNEPIKAETVFDFQNTTVPAASQTVFEKEEPKSITLNDRLIKEITIGLNDRIAFVKHLFGGSNEDYNRVLSQLITFDTFLETKAFIDEMVKPDYNNWEGKEDYEHRFMEIIEKKFLSF
ncbi:hypothetical protein [Flavobacterium sp.]|uniref:hypothetical protein n=1 Tax=Flavobacterium sp. TaxID=239 RepID=UPI002C9BCD98|nr:hypothetical protein [Flavobacterium sp.]HSD07567.1 hypothetical protein [Flavobacterium sp.]